MSRREGRGRGQSIHFEKAAKAGAQWDRKRAGHIKLLRRVWVRAHPRRFEPFSRWRKYPEGSRD
jgi:hypothetical protein